jgi:tRNA pseudouridine32 synthase/23S rRNA pseudouridine746 synthase
MSLPRIVHLDDSLLVLDKPAGLLSAPGRGEHLQDCLVTRVQAAYPDALLVHRLDMATSGLIVLARGREVHARLSRAFRERQVGKQYEAVVDGWLADDAGEIDAPLAADWPNRPLQKVDRVNGKPSRTLFRVIGRQAEPAATRVALEPLTGRTHQLRVHLLALGHPILGDALYGGERVQAAAPRLLLHATGLRLRHPRDGGELSFRSGAPF